MSKSQESASDSACAATTPLPFRFDADFGVLMWPNGDTWRRVLNCSCGCHPAGGGCAQLSCSAQRFDTRVLRGRGAVLLLAGVAKRAMTMRGASCLSSATSRACFWGQAGGVEGLRHGTAHWP